MQTLDRRHFFSAGALALAGSSLPLATPTAAAAPAKAAGRIKLALATYSYWHFTRNKYPIEKVIDHAAEMGAQNAPEAPLVFTKSSSSLIADGETVELDESFTNALDYEGEIAVVIGKAGRRISKENAKLKHELRDYKKAMEKLKPLITQGNYANK